MSSKCEHHYKSRRQQLPVPAPSPSHSRSHSHSHSHSHSDLSGESFLQYCTDGDKKPPPIVVVVGDGRSRVRRVVRTRHKETQTHTSHHVTAVR
ncbi:GL15346 [Drosophila persimilis]|uniref:GL15346 n=1 Tax=Drosophila persimilis TaxID=7234 RepID=B4HCH6_DROPE|nr:GL15346 [Drosophila persimilis]